MTTINPQQLKSRKPFRELFPIREDTLNAVVEHMRVHGFDPSYPIVCAHIDDKITVIDGHTRLKAARMRNLDAVPVILKTFSSEDEALQHAIHSQRDRRNLTDADILRCIEAVDKTKRRGERSDLASRDARSEKSAQNTAKVVGTSARKVEKARTVLKKADPDTKQAVLQGKKTINKAYKEIKAKDGKKQEPQLSRQFDVTESSQIAAMATTDLSRIREDDPKREEGVDKVVTWINGQTKEPQYMRVLHPEFEIKYDPRCNALNFACMARSQLERIRDDDPRREEAFNEVEQWIKNQLSGSRQAPSAEPKAIANAPLLKVLVTAYHQINRLKRQGWEGCPKETIKEDLHMLLRLVEE